MRQLSVPAVPVVAGLLIWIVVAAVAGPAENPAPALGVDVEIEASQDDPDALRATFALRNLQTGETVARPRLLLPRGETGTIEQGSSERAFRFTVDATTDGRISYRVTLVEDGRELVISSGRFAQGSTESSPS